MSPRTSRKKTRRQETASFIIQGGILVMVSIVIRIIGTFYGTPLNDITEKQGNGYYTSAFSTYNILFILSSYGMPVAMSKIVSTQLAGGEHRNCSRVLETAFIYATVVGGIVVVVLWSRVDLFAQLIGTPFSRYTLKTLAPTTWTMAYLGVFRGYFQGAGTMAPTAISQILEQTINAVISVVAAGILFDAGTSIGVAQGAKDCSYMLEAVGGTTGTEAGVLTVFLFFICLTASKGRERRQMVREDVSGRTESYHRIFYVLTITVLPIVISSGICNCPNVMDDYLLGQGMDKLGYMENSIAAYWGMLGQYQLLFNIPTTISNVSSSSLISSLTRTVADGNREEKLERITISIRSSLLIAIPAVVGITVLTKSVCNLLFISEDNTMLIRSSMAGSLAVIFYSLSTIMDAVLQGLDHMDVPICRAVTALVIHVMVLEVFLMVFKIRTYSVVFVNIIFALVMCLLNGHAIARLARYRQEYKKTLIPLTICTGFMGTTAYGVYRGIYALFLNQLMRGRMGMVIVVFPSVVVAILVYVALLVKFRVMEEEELKGMLGGGKLVRLSNRFRLLG